ncbi:hypothetical protein GYMLUDRAFT_34881 [Collybiopsis luxurians FD-317 M1]|nr:hypothetical protein GYMLUDRAFT_34881 [Collybiopsis luxurians FD-317 M1]
MRSILAHFMANRYAQIKAENPGKGRRYWQLRALQEFWTTSPSPPEQNEPSEASSASGTNVSTQDDDLCDVLVSDVVGGIILRTDYSDEESWNVFSAKLKEAEGELSGAVQEDNGDAGASSADTKGPSEPADIDMEDNDEDYDSEEEEGKLIKVVNPTSQEERAILKNISNLRALRLFNDVDIQPAPPVPAGTKRVSPPNRLVDAFGWQEVYTGVTLWIYDTQSNSDHSARLVSGSGDAEVYGTATGDSWRAQVTHIPELQLNMTFENMKISFGGLDRWDYVERKRNLEEADILAA